MYQRATHQPINGPAAVEFLLHHDAFPRSVRFCVDRMAYHLGCLPRGDEVLPEVRKVADELETPVADPEDGALLDAAMDRIQLALACVSEAINATYGGQP